MGVRPGWFFESYTDPRDNQAEDDELLSRRETGEVIRAYWSMPGPVRARWAAMVTELAAPSSDEP